MNTRELKFKFFAPTNLTGKPYSELRSWIEDLVRALFPDNGIEYWADPEHLARKPGDTEELTPKEGRPAWVSQVQVSVCHGSNEGRRIDVSLKLRDGSHRTVTWAKSFGSGDKCWAIARVISEALELVFHYEEQPLIVDLYRALPREHRWLSTVSIPGGVTLIRDHSSVSIFLPGHVLLSRRDFGGRPEGRKPYMDAYQADWLTVLQAHKVPTTVDVRESAATAADVRLDRAA